MIEEFLQPDHGRLHLRELPASEFFQRQCVLIGRTVEQTEGFDATGLPVEVHLTHRLDMDEHALEDFIGVEELSAVK